jgi:hypothetical protein
MDPDPISRTGYSQDVDLFFTFGSAGSGAFEYVIEASTLKYVFSTAPDWVRIRIRNSLFRKCKENMKSWGGEGDVFFFGGGGGGCGIFSFCFLLWFCF